MKCDRCGRLCEESGNVHQAVELCPGGDRIKWVRKPSIRGVKVTIIIAPINYDSGGYMGLDVCGECFNEVLALAIPYFKVQNSAKQDQAE